VPWESRDSHLLDGQSNVRRSHGDVGSLGSTTTGDATNLLEVNFQRFGSGPGQQG
jgi:hypothetical protein